MSLDKGDHVRIKINKPNLVRGFNIRKIQEKLTGGEVGINTVYSLTCSHGWGDDCYEKELILVENNMRWIPNVTEFISLYSKEIGVALDVKKAEDIAILERTSMCKFVMRAKPIGNIAFPVIKNISKGVDAGQSNSICRVYSYKGGTKDAVKYVVLYNHHYSDSTYVLYNKKYHKNMCKAVKTLYQLYEAEKTEVFDLVLNDDIKKLLLDNTVGFVRTVKEFQRFNLNRSKGIILYGPPGCGKTSIAKWLSSKMEELDWSVYDKCIAGGKLPEDRNNCFCIFDDINIAALNRNRNSPLTTEMIHFLDGVDKQNSRISLFTTNEKLDDIEEAMRRPGRIDTAIEVGLPNDEARTAYYLNITEQVRSDVSLTDWMKETKGYSFAAMAQLYGRLLEQALIYNEKANIYSAKAYIKDLMELDINSKKKLGF